MPGKLIQVKAYKKNEFKKTGDYLKLNCQYSEFRISFLWVFHGRCGYKFDARVARAAK
jgi:hypothetical protein